MALTTTTTSKEASMFVKVIYPGGRVEFLNKPVLAAEIMSQNPKCWVTLPGVFQQPWAVLPPDASLALGQKFYVVPETTVLKLRRRFMRSFNDQTTSPSCATRTLDPPPTVSRRRARIEGVCLNLSTLRRPFRCLMQTSGGEVDRLPRRKSSRTCLAVAVAKGAAGKGNPRRDDVSAGRRRWRRRTRGSASPGTPTHYWQPSLQSISEE